MITRAAAGAPPPPPPPPPRGIFNTVCFLTDRQQRPFCGEETSWQWLKPAWTLQMLMAAAVLSLRSVTVTSARTNHVETEGQRGNTNSYSRTLMDVRCMWFRLISTKSVSFISSLGRCPEHMQLKVTLKQTQDRTDPNCHLKLYSVLPLLIFFLG